MLQYVAVCGATFLEMCKQCLSEAVVKVFCSVSQCVAVCCSVVQRSAAYCNMMQGIAVCGRERWGAGVETPKNVRGEIGGWGRVPFNETYAPSLSTIYDGA